MQPTQAIVTNHLLVLYYKMSSQNRMTLLFMDQDAAHPPARRLYKNVKVVFLYAKTVQAFPNHLTKELSSYSNIISTSNLQEELLL